MHLYNTKSRSLETFEHDKNTPVTMYNCGPTVYNYAHIGNLRAYVFADTLRRALEWNGYAVNQVINITDVGHLVSDADEGEDKMLVAAKREGTGMEAIIKKYSDAFHQDLKALNCEIENDGSGHFPRATENIPEQIALIQKLESKGFVYVTSDGVYFDTSKDPEYANFAHLDLEGMRAGARVELGEKRNSTDFALWKFHMGEGVREQEWESPSFVLKSADFKEYMRKGFPGWHIECSAMAMKYLGETLDIHTGGVDHIPVHHTNEIAQSESVTGKPFANFWMHVAFMNADGQKMSKSLGNTYLLSQLAEHCIEPLAYRYWLLMGHYRTQMNFTFEAAKAAQTALERLRKKLSTLPDGGKPDKHVRESAGRAINQDLNTALLISFIHQTLGDNSITAGDQRATILEIDKLLGLNLKHTPSSGEPNLSFFAQALEGRASELAELRKEARAKKQWGESDRLRDELLALGYRVKDTASGQEIEKA